MAIDYKKLGLRICKFRSDKKLSQETLARDVNSSRKHISLIEIGTAAPSLDLLVDIANALEISVDDLLVDSLSHSVSTANSEIHRLLIECNETETTILTEMVKHLKTILYSQGI